MSVTLVQYSFPPYINPESGASAEVIQVSALWPGSSDLIVRGYYSHSGAGGVVWSQKTTVTVPLQVFLAPSK